MLERNGFRFDMGPTILTLPSVLKRVFKEADRRLEDYLELVKLEPQWRSFFEDGTTLDLVSDLREMATTLDRFAPGKALGGRYSQFMKLSKRLHEISDKYFFYKPIGGMRDMFDLKGSFKPGALGDVLAMRMGGTVGGTIRSHIPDERVSQMLDHFTQYVGSAPDASPAVLCGIANMQTEEGVWYPMGGTGAVPKALAKLANELGVTMHTGVGIRRILVNNGKVSGLETDSGEVSDCAYVVSNMDAVRTHRELLGERMPQLSIANGSMNRRVRGWCCILACVRNTRTWPITTSSSRDPHEEEFDSIYRQGEPAPDPTCYLCPPGTTEPGVAPKAGKALNILVNTPYLRSHHDWNRMLRAYRKRFLKLPRTRK